MKNKLAVITAALALLYIGSATAQEQPENNQPVNPVSGFGSGTGMGPGGGEGSSTSLTGGPGSTVGTSGGGSQTFGGGFPGAGPLSTPPAAPCVGSVARPC